MKTLSIRVLLAALLLLMALPAASASAASPTSYTWTGNPSKVTGPIDLGPFDPTNAISWGAATPISERGMLDPNMPGATLTVGGLGGNLGFLNGGVVTTGGYGVWLCALAGIGFYWCGDGFAPSSGEVVLTFTTHPDTDFSITICSGKVNCTTPPPTPKAPPCGMQPSGVDTCNLKPGDILLETQYPAAGIWTINGVQTDSWMSGLIREASGEYWFHVGVVDTDGSILDFQGEGARKTKLDSVSFLQATDQDVVVLRPKDQTKVAGALAWMHARLGQNLPYYNPVQAIADTALHGSSYVTGQQAQFYCSLFVWAAYNAQGLDLAYRLPLEHLLGLHPIPAFAMLPAGPDSLYNSAFPDVTTLRGAATDVVQDTHPGLYRWVSVLHSPASESLTGQTGGVVWTGAASEPQSLAALVAPTAAPVLTLQGTGVGQYTLTVETLGGGASHSALVQAHITPQATVTYDVANLSAGVTLTRKHSNNGLHLGQLGRDSDADDVNDRG